MTEEQQQTAKDVREEKVQRERRFQTWMIGICTACVPVGLGAAWWSVQQLSAVPSIIKRIDAIDSRLYSKVEAEKDLYGVDVKIGALEKRVNAQDTKVENIDRRTLIIETNQALHRK